MAAVAGFLGSISTAAPKRGQLLLRKTPGSSRCTVMRGLRPVEAQSGADTAGTPLREAQPPVGALEGDLEELRSGPAAGNADRGQPDGRKALLHEALQRLSEEGLEAAAEKYNLHQELFAELDFVRINAFSPSPFGGNPAAVVYLPYMPADKWLQKVAAEFNLSETAYVVRRRQGPLQRSEDSRGVKAVGPKARRPLGNEFDLRWFTPSTEVKLCGHATLASAHFLFTAGLLERDCDTVVFHTLSGPLLARRVPEEASLLSQRLARAQGEGVRQEATPENAKGVGRRETGGRRPKGRSIVELSLPLMPLTPLEPSAEHWTGLEAALRLPEGSLLYAGRNSLHYILAEVASEEEVMAARPDMEAVAQLPVVGVILTARTRHHSSSTPPDATSQDGTLAAGSQWAEELRRADFVARFFGPQVGVVEDPVTGSAFCSLGPFWAERLGRSELVGFQASQRGGEVAVTVDVAENRAKLQGWAVMVQAGVLLNTVGPGAK